MVTGSTFPGDCQTRDRTASVAELDKIILLFLLSSNQQYIGSINRWSRDMREICDVIMTTSRRTPVCLASRTFGEALRRGAS